jgi:hypothetical protein
VISKVSVEVKPQLDVSILVGVDGELGVIVALFDSCVALARSNSICSFA